VVGHVERITAPAAAALAPGEGGLISVEGRNVAAYRDPDGRLHLLSAVCTHLGCTVRWNPAETTWDCPCHGSRYDTDGQPIDGPTVRPLHQVATNTRDQNHDEGPSG
jgi:Rieske Fe-S protein